VDAEVADLIRLNIISDIKLELLVKTDAGTTTSSATCEVVAEVVFKAGLVDGMIGFSSLGCFC
jgi:hypothetical protein